MRLILIFLIALSFPALAQVYKWTDENGVTHFGSQPPPGERKSVDATNPPPSGGSPEASAKSDIMRQAQEMRRRNAEEALERAERRYNRSVSSARDDYRNRPDYVCQGAKDDLKNIKDRWQAKRRQGYTISEEDYYEQRITEAERHRDNICR